MLSKILAAVGNVFGRVTWLVRRNWNPENRAIRAIERGNRGASPHHPIVDQQLARQRASNPQLAQQLQQPQSSLLQRLNDVYVTSSSSSGDGPEPDASRPESSGLRSRLPGNSQRLNPDPLPAGVGRPRRVPYGRASFETVAQLLERHRTGDQSVTELARHYCIDEQTCADIVAHFSVMQLYQLEDLAQIELAMAAADKKAQDDKANQVTKRLLKE